MGNTTGRNQVGATGLGTFGGVFTPSILTILGVIMYLRFGWVVGQAGLTGSLIIVTIATAITFLTGLSIAQIATDQRGQGGRGLLHDQPGAGRRDRRRHRHPALPCPSPVGRALHDRIRRERRPRVPGPRRAHRWRSVTTVLVTAVALVSARVAIRAQYFIMAGIALVAAVVLLRTTRATVEAAATL